MPAWGCTVPSGVACGVSIVKCRVRIPNGQQIVVSVIYFVQDNGCVWLKMFNSVRPERQAITATYSGQCHAYAIERCIAISVVRARAYNAINVFPECCIKLAEGVSPIAPKFVVVIRTVCRSTPVPVPVVVRLAAIYLHWGDQLAVAVAKIDDSSSNRTHRRYCRRYRRPGSRSYPCGGG